MPASVSSDSPALGLEDLLALEGRYGAYGGRYVPEILQPNMQEVADGFAACRRDPAFRDELQTAYRELCGRPTPLLPLDRLSDALGGARLLLKNEGMNLTGAHKINHCLGQVLVAKRLGKQRIIAETGAGQHGYATATVCARYGMPCTIYMGRKDYERQRPNVYWMELLGAEVVPVEEGAQTLNDAVIAAFKDLITNPEEGYYLLGSAVGPHPYPIMNAWFQWVVGEETKAQVRERFGRLPDACLACLGGGSNASGFFLPFLEDEGVELIGVEAGGRGDSLGDHAARSRGGRPGVFEGYASYFLQDADGNIAPTHSISAGLDYCGMSPLLAYLADAGRLQLAAANDGPVLDAVQQLARREGLILALESAHALAHAIERAPTMPADRLLVINGSGRGEKDLFITMQALQPEALRRFMETHLAEHPTGPTS